MIKSKFSAHVHRVTKFSDNYVYPNVQLLLAMIGGFDNNMMWLYLDSDGTQPRIKLRNLSKDLFTQVVYNLSLHGDFKVQITLGR